MDKVSVAKRAAKFEKAARLTWVDKAELAVVRGWRNREELLASEAGQWVSVGVIAAGVLLAGNVERIA